MKKIIVFLFISVIGYTVNAQRFQSYEDNWKASVGLNTVGNLSTENPFERLGDYAFRFPLAVAIEYQWDKKFAIEQDISLNGFKAGHYINKTTATKDLTYFSTNTNFKWYISEYMFDLDYLDIYASGGVGMFYLDDFTGTLNLSGGVQYWFNQDIAIRFQSSAKFAMDKKLYANNHFQHMLMVVFRL